MVHCILFLEFEVLVGTSLKILVRVEWLNPESLIGDDIIYNNIVIAYYNWGIRKLIIPLMFATANVCGNPSFHRLQPVNSIASCKTINYKWWFKVETVCLRSLTLTQSNLELGLMYWFFVSLKVSLAFISVKILLVPY